MKTGGYIVKVRQEPFCGLWSIELIGINGKGVFPPKGFTKRSYAIRQAKSFVKCIDGRVKLDIKDAV